MSAIFFFPRCGTGCNIATLVQSAHMLSLQVVIGVGLLAAVSYAVKQFVAPKVSQWYHEWRQDDDNSKAEEEQQQKTAQLVADAIQGQVWPFCVTPCRLRA